MSDIAIARRERRGDVDAVVVGVQAHEHGDRFLMALLLADSTPPGSPSAGCIGVALQASRLQPTVLQVTGPRVHEAILSRCHRNSHGTFRLRHPA